MKRLGLILAASWLMTASVAKAGELDAEYVGKISTTAPILAKPSSELDAESPTQACCFKRRFYAYGYGGPGGYAYGYGYGRGFCRFGYGGGFGYGGYGGFGGYGGYGMYGGGLGYGGFGGYGGGFY